MLFARLNSVTLKYFTIESPLIDSCKHLRVDKLNSILSIISTKDLKLQDNQVIASPCPFSLHFPAKERKDLLLQVLGLYLSLLVPGLFCSPLHLCCAAWHFALGDFPQATRCS